MNSPQLVPGATVAVIGWGNMGGPIAQHWIRQGFAVRGYDQSAAARARIASTGAVAAPSAAEAARGADVTVLLLPDSGAVAGVLADIDASGALLTVVGTVHHVGPPGAGHAIKALNNLLSASHLWLTSEAVLIAGRAGVEPGAALEVFNTSSGRSGSSDVKWPKFILTETYDSGFAARLMLKDARIATDLARVVKLPSRLGEEVVRQWAEAVADLGPAADHTEVARWLRGDAQGSGSS